MVRGRKRGRPKDDEPLNMGDTLNAVWVLLTQVLDYWQAKDHGQLDKGKLRSFLIDFHGLIDGHLDEPPSSEEGLSDRLYAFQRARSGVQSEFWALKGRAGSPPRSVDAAKAGLEVLIKESGLSEFGIQATSLLITGDEITRNGGPAAAADIVLRKALNLPSERTMDKLVSRIGTPKERNPPVEDYEIEAIELLLVNAGYARRFAKKVVEPLKSYDPNEWRGG